MNEERWGAYRAAVMLLRIESSDSLKSLGKDKLEDNLMLACVGD